MSAGSQRKWLLSIGLRVNSVRYHLHRWLTIWKRKRWVRVSFAVGAILLVGIAEFKLTNVAQVIDVGVSDREFTPLYATVGQDDITLSGSPTKDGVLLSLKQAPVTVDFDFERATLGPDSIKLFLSLNEKSSPPDIPSSIKYFARSEFEPIVGRDKKPISSVPRRTCRMNAQVRASNSDSQVEIHYFHDRVGTDQEDSLELWAMNAALIVETDLESPEPKSIGCARTLQIGQWIHAIGPLGLDFVIEPNTKIRLSWKTISEDSALVQNSNLLWLIEVGDQLRFVNSIQVRRSVGDSDVVSSAIPSAEVQAYSRSQPLKVNDIKVVEGDLSVSYVGKAWIKKNGRYLTINYLELIGKYPIIASLLGIFNLFLLTLAGRTIYRPTKKDGG